VPLTDLIEAATSVRVTRVGAASTRASTSLALVAGPHAMAALRDALDIDTASFARRVSLNTQGVVDLHFFREDQLIATVTYVARGFVRWEGWRYDAQLRHPLRLAEWFTEQC